MHLWYVGTRTIETDSSQMVGDRGDRQDPSFKRRPKILMDFINDMLDKINLKIPIKKFHLKKIEKVSSFFK